VQEEKLNILFSHQKFAQLGLPFEAIAPDCHAKRDRVDWRDRHPTDNLQVRVSGALKTVKDLEELERAPAIPRSGWRLRRRQAEYQDPPLEKDALQRQEVIGLGVSMERAAISSRWARA
jgi:hypothetical protein